MAIAVARGTSSLSQGRETHYLDMSLFPLKGDYQGFTFRSHSDRGILKLISPLSVSYSGFKP